MPLLKGLECGKLYKYLRTMREGAVEFTPELEHLRLRGLITRDRYLYQPAIKSNSSGVFIRHKQDTIFYPRACELYGIDPNDV